MEACYLDKCTLSEGRARPPWPQGRPWPGPKGSGSGPAIAGRVGPGSALALLYIKYSKKILLNAIILQSISLIYDIFYHIAYLQLYYSQILDFYIKRKDNIQLLFCFITVLYSPEALINSIIVYSSIYNCYISNIITYIIYFSTYLKIGGPGVGPGPALTRP